MSWQPAQPARSDRDAAPPVAETVATRPEPGLARGVWEAPAWAFWVALATILLGAGLYGAARAGFLARLTDRRKNRPK